jgi:hypothetical protein
MHVVTRLPREFGQRGYTADLDAPDPALMALRLCRNGADSLAARMRPVPHGYLHGRRGWSAAAGRATGGAGCSSAPAWGRRSSRPSSPRASTTGGGASVPPDTSRGGHGAAGGFHMLVLGPPPRRGFGEAASSSADRWLPVLRHRRLRPRVRAGRYANCVVLRAGPVLPAGPREALARGPGPSRRARPCGRHRRGNAAATTQRRGASPDERGRVRG